MTRSYKVFVDDNSSYMESEGRYKLGEFETFNEAVEACKSIVEDFLNDNYKSGMTSDHLYRLYTFYGDDPFVVGDPIPFRFSAWSYAEDKCQEICKAEKPEESVTKVPLSFADYDVIQGLIKITRKILTLRYLEPIQIISLAHAIFALERLPELTPGIYLEYDISLEGENDDYSGKEYWSISIFDSSLKISSGGSSYDPNVGSDSFTLFSWEVDASGFRNCDGSFQSWLDGAKQALRLHPKVNISDESDEIEL